jgi:IS30 family transposase
VEDKSAMSTLDALVKTIESVPKELAINFTFDNGSEGVLHVELKEMFMIKTYFCDPYKSWLKGGGQIQTSSATFQFSKS